MMHEKLNDDHLSRKAVLYIRQSSPYQVAHHEESRRLQYAMKDRLEALGWRQIEVVDEDLGRTAAGTADRRGFDQMVAEVCLGHVGAVAAREVSRFARNSREWQRLVEVCRMVNTVLIDHESIYDPRRSNDRLLLGLKGSLNEYELDLLRQRALAARTAKAKRGELVAAVPAGYLKTPDGGLEKDPDRRVQQTLHLVFEKIMELGSLRQLLLWMLEHDLKIPVRRHDGTTWQTMWRRPSYPSLHRLVNNPVYAGAYAYGKTQVFHRFEDGRPRKRARRRSRDQWTALIRDHHPGYITWDRFEQVQAMIRRNQNGTAGTGAAKRGPALLIGLLRCARCGRKLSVKYTGRRHDVPRYVCCRGQLDHAEPKCIEFGGIPVDQAVAEQILAVIQPAAIEASTTVQAQIAHEHQEVIERLQLDVQEAQYQAERARRQYDAVDPANRLVADELERRWNEALAHVQSQRARLENATSEHPCQPLPDADQVHRLASDLESLWNDVGTDVRLKKRIIRTLIEEVVVDTDGSQGQMLLVIHWKGGVHTQVRVARRRRGRNRLHTCPEATMAVRQLALIWTDDLIAGGLNRNGLRTGHGNRWTKERVASLRSWHKIPRYRGDSKQARRWMTLTRAAGQIGVSPGTLRAAVERGKVPALHPLPDGPWIFAGSDLQGPIVEQIVQRARSRCATPAKAHPEQLSLGYTTT